MKTFALSMAFVVALVLFGCASKEIKLTTMPDGGSGYVAACGGQGGSWGPCYEQAAKKCPAGFDILDRESYGTAAHRNLYFRCTIEPTS